MTEAQHLVTADIRLIFTDQVTGRKVAQYYTVALEKPGAFKSEILEDEPTEIFCADDVEVKRVSTKYLDLRIDKCRLIPGGDGHIVYVRVIEEGRE